MRVQALENELRRRRPHAVRIVRLHAKHARLVHETLNRFQPLHHGCRVYRVVQLQRAAQIEPLHDLRHVRPLEILVVNFAHGKADQLFGDGIAAFELAFVFQLQLAGDGRQSGIYIQDAWRRHCLARA